MGLSSASIPVLVAKARADNACGARISAANFLVTAIPVGPAPIVEISRQAG